MQTPEALWAHDTFAHAELGDPRRTRRLVRVAEAAAQRPGGTVTSVFLKPSEREGAFRLLENRQVKAADVAASLHISTVRRCAEHPWVYISVDQSNLTFRDPKNTRGLGKAGDGKTRRMRGIQVMSGFALDPEGVPLGLCATRWFLRLSAGWVRRDGRPVEVRESGMWLDALDDISRLFSEHAPATKPWLQIDSGGDYWRVFDVAREHGLDLTVRAVHNRVIKDGDGFKLLEAGSRARVFGRLVIWRPRRSGVTQRRIRLSLRARPVTLMLADENKPRRPYNLWVVRIREMGRCSGRAPIVWNLLTTHPVENLGDALAVVHGYTLRWRVEEFHRTWKRGHCQMERSQLRSRPALQKWAIILAAVAARIERLKRRSRAESEIDALSEFTREELDAAIIISRTDRWKVGATMTLGEAVELIARVGGYTGKSSGGPPGATTLGRGLDRISPAVEVLRHVRPTCD